MKEIFQQYLDKAADGVFAQGRASIRTGGGCAYRATIDGIDCKCGVGHLIPDEKYCSSFEGQAVAALATTLAGDGIFPADVLRTTFLDKLQLAHDDAGFDRTMRPAILRNPPDVFLRKFDANMIALAKKYDLKYESRFNA